MPGAGRSYRLTIGRLCTCAAINRARLTLKVGIVVLAV